MAAVNLGLPGAGPAIDLVDGSSVSSEQAELAELHHLEMEAIHNGSVASVHSWELVTAVDGPGTRMTLFLSGCLLRCQYCHNPDTWKMKDGLLTTLDDLVTRVERYKGVFDATGGGLTISGGEPLMQPAFVTRMFEECHKLGVHTTLDTSGFLGKSASDKLLDNLDLVLLDVKSGIPETYKEVTGRELAPTIAFGDRLAERNIPVWVRFVLVPGLTDAVDNVDAVAEIVSRWPNVERVEVLPFHQMGEDKWDRLKIPYPLHGAHPPDEDLLERVRGQFEARGLTVF
ncbi:pyruvate formate lyase-activating protein [Cryobacterium sp. TMT1-21]|uniref:Pyruvate formate-lyase-activating enzyme n=1 Tax=Cryobacterium shii TaxID=1259235 RepID=A0AAQ2C8K1_9MICO|nr:MULTISPECIES: pyruvate formate-lyase-activating protein [Cryobacterium]TFC52173.1 pyruvate formate lyase-activating protein [Cryobacterium shii]TFD14549.1 pyruvate formate lyase-activating protein [Cryobacterium sp. TMT4-10]TFD15700.1 pyruvate formate lyase-activating protein [Cryobacterium sp. TMT1-21]TFD18999.1 pyruvate formate lyase-activating protein [Cryobacterium sp. TMT2-23]TFD39383.1 pyruvate formate lyase-activating protein [Cryobacterium sp. TMT2-10]